jgi:hypothetical protein
MAIFNQSKMRFLLSLFLILSLLSPSITLASLTSIASLESEVSEKGLLLETSLDPRDFVYEDIKGTSIELQDVEAKSYGVDVLVRAVTSKGEPVGFSLDGSVEIEKIRFVNPPVFVPDGSFRICDILGKKYECPNFRYAPDEALRLIVSDVIDKNGKVGADIVPGKVGRTTTVVYSNPSGSSPFDAYVRTDPGATGTTWSAQRGALAGDGANTSDGFTIVQIRAATVSNQWRNIGRSIFGFDTSSIPDTDTVTSATLSLYDQYSATNPTSFGTQRLFVVGAPNPPQSSFEAKVGDFNISSWDVASYSDTELTFSDWNGSNGYEVFTLNSTGLSNINLATSTWLGLISSSDFNNVAPTWSNNVESYIIPISSDNSGTTLDPKLTIEHSFVEPPPSETSSSTPTRFSTTTCTGTDPQICVTEYIPEVYYHDFMIVATWMIFLMSFPTIGFFLSGLKYRVKK